MSGPFEPNIGLIICIPTLGRAVPLTWAWAFKNMVPSINYNVEYLQINGKQVAEARNEAAEYAVKKNVRYLFFVGDDVVVPQHTLKQLIFRMENNEKLGVVGGIYCSKSDPPAPLVFRGNGAGSYWDWKAGEFFEVTGLGMDCTLIRTEVFKEVSKPWFNTEDSNKFLDGVNAAQMWTEDLYFLWKVHKETEWKIYADATVLCEHWDVSKNKSYTLPFNSLPFRHISVNGKKRILDIGSGPIVQTELAKEGDLVRVDLRDECNPDYRCDVRQLPFDNKSFDVVFSSHVLEHFDRHEFNDVLTEWLRVLKEDGELRLVLPNIKWAAAKVMNDDIDNDVLNVLYGGQSNPYDYHMNGFTPLRLKQILCDKGLEVKEQAENWYNMIFVAKYKQETVLLK